MPSTADAKGGLEARRISDLAGGLGALPPASMGGAWAFCQKCTHLPLLASNGNDDKQHKSKYNVVVVLNKHNKKMKGAIRL